MKKPLNLLENIVLSILGFFLMIGIMGLAEVYRKHYRIKK